LTVAAEQNIRAAGVNLGGGVTISQRATHTFVNSAFEAN